MQANELNSDFLDRIDDALLEIGPTQKPINFDEVIAGLDKCTLSSDCPCRTCIAVYTPTKGNAR